MNWMSCEMHIEQASYFLILEGINPYWLRLSGACLYAQLLFWETVLFTKRNERLKGRRGSIVKTGLLETQALS